MTQRSQRKAGGAPVAATPTPAPTEETKPEIESATAPEVAPEAPTPAPTEADKGVPMLLHKDAWDENGVRRKAGSVVNLPADLARSLNKAGKAERYDPLLQD